MSPHHFVPPPTDTETIRAWDRTAIEEYGVPGAILMENAGEGCVRVIESLLEDPSAGIEPPFQIVCGPGNNGGDGFVVARHLFNRGIDVRVHLTVPRSKVRADSDAGLNLRIIESMDLPIAETPVGDAAVLGEGTIVDAIFGTGLTRAVRSPQLEWIEAINGSARPVLAIDIPSGLDGDTGEVLGAAVRARYTMTFVAPKIGFGRGEGPERTGEIVVVGISIPRQVLERGSPRAKP